MKFTLRFKSKKINLQVKKLNWFGRFIGLMFSQRQKAQALLFDFKKPVRIAIHSWFVFFDFYAIWIDNVNKIIEIRKVKPWSCFVRSKREYVKLIEVPVNEKYASSLHSLGLVAQSQPCGKAFR